MKRFLLSLLILAVFIPAFSQKVYYIYLQSENDQPFFVRLNDKTHSSSASGYLILSRLRDSSYTFSVGFPQNKFGEQKFSVSIKGKDRGYLLKNFGEKGWGLFDLQTLTIQMASPDTGSKTIKTVPRDDISPFTEILARAANDPSLKERPVAVKMEQQPVVVQAAVLKEEVKPEIALAEEKEKRPPPLAEKKPPVVEKRDSLSVKQGEETVRQQPLFDEKHEQQLVIDITEPAIARQEPVAEKKEISIAPAEYKRSVVTKRAESSTSVGFGLTFIDEYADGKKDTIRIIIPHPKEESAGAKDQPKEDKKFLDISTTDTVKETAKEESLQNPAGSNCSATASDNDFLKLQKKMMGEKNAEGMIDEAKKAFRSKCFATVQLKTLSFLFTNDNGKYKFFDAAYQSVADMDNFPSLVTELKDEYYINRFKAMLR